MNGLVAFHELNTLLAINRKWSYYHFVCFFIWLLLLWCVYFNVVKSLMTLYLSSFNVVIAVSTYRRRKERYVILVCILHFHHFVFVLYNSSPYNNYFGRRYLTSALMIYVFNILYYWQTSNSQWFFRVTSRARKFKFLSLGMKSMLYSLFLETMFM